MQTITTIGLDIAKSVFQVHGVDAGGQVIVRRQLKRRYVLTFFQKLSPCLVGIESLRLFAPREVRVWSAFGCKKEVGFRGCQGCFLTHCGTGGRSSTAEIAFG